MYKKQEKPQPPAPPKPDPRDNERQATSWNSALCYLCWYPGTIKIGERLYCAKHAEKAGKDGK